MISTVAVLTCAGSPAAAQVEIVGGRHKTNVNTYQWTVTNSGRQPIVAFEFPRYVVEHLGAPVGWSAELVKKAPDGTPLAQQRVVYRALPNTRGIRPGESAEFSAVITIDKATPGLQTATVEFADGTKLSIPNVEIPWGISWFEKYALLIGMGTLFAMFLAVQVIRSRRKKPAW